MKLTLIVAYASNRVIGRDNDLPWRLPGDLAYFKKQTQGHPIIMGRKTWDSLGRPLPGRHNIVVSRDAGYRPAGATACTSLQAAIEACAGEDAFVIGGAQLYALALPLAQRVLATEIDAQVQGDTFFPELPAASWRETARSAPVQDNGHRYCWVTYERQDAGR